VPESAKGGDYPEGGRGYSAVLLRGLMLIFARDL